MELSDFGTEAARDSRDSLNKILKIKAEVAPSITGDQNDNIFEPKLCQWTSTGPNEYMGVAETRKIIPPGVYNQDITNRGDVVFSQMDIKVDNLMEIPDSLHEAVLKEIDDFWMRGKLFQDFGFLHRRGYLLYGPQGSGKMAIVQQVIARIVKAGDIVLMCDRPAILIEALSAFRQVEPNRRIVCVYEDIDAIVSNHGEDRLLALLDGENQVDKVLNIATTNYPERLDKRLVARPRRFDRVIKVGMPNENVRRVYLRAKISKEALNDEHLETWVKLTDGLSFASMAELVISVFCLGNTFEKTLEILRTMTKAKSSSGEFEESSIGIRI